MNYIDRFLNNITMYRLLLYVLIGLLGIAFVFSFFHLLPFTPVQLVPQTIYLVAVCYIANKLLARLFSVHTNIESVYISALILSLIITPQGMQNIEFLTLAAIITITSKFVIAINRKHLFNPVAFGVFISGLITSQFASWWIGTGSLMPFVLLFGFLIIRKIRREDMVFTFIVLATLSVLFLGGTGSVIVILQKLFFETPILFFACIMLTEPLTTPPTKKLQLLYAGIIGVLFNPHIHVAYIYSTPELVLILGNVYAYIVSPQIRLILTLQKKIHVSPDIYDFIFSKEKKLSFSPGQYMEWTLSHPSTDSRGNRRYFTIASSPTEEQLMIGVRFNKNGSSFKNALLHLSKNAKLIAGQLAGDFTLPNDTHKKIVCIAGGIGITPFRSQIKYLLDKYEKRDIVLLYTAKNINEFAYKNIFDNAKKLGIKTVYILTDESSTPSGWVGEKGRINEKMIQKYIPDFMERIFYLSGPNAMVGTYEKLLKQIGISSNNIKKDYFPGFA